MTELKQLRDFAEQLNGIRPQERSLKGVVNNLISNYKGGEVVQSDWKEEDTESPAYIKNKPTIPATPH